MKRTVMLHLLLTLTLFGTLAAQTVRVATYASAGSQLIVQESVLKSAFETALNDGTTMSRVGIYDTLGTQEIYGVGILNDASVSVYITLQQESDGNLTYLVATVGDSEGTKCYRYPGCELCHECVKYYDNGPKCSCSSRNDGPCLWFCMYEPYPNISIPDFVGHILNN